MFLNSCNLGTWFRLLLVFVQIVERATSVFAIGSFKPVHARADCYSGLRLGSLQLEFFVTVIAGKVPTIRSSIYQEKLLLYSVHSHCIMAAYAAGCCYCSPNFGSLSTA